MKNENKRVYVVRGSEDGVLGVFTNKKLACICACKYTETSFKTHYPKACKGVESHYYYDVVGKADQFGCVSAEIQEFNLNNDPIK